MRVREKIEKPGSFWLPQSPERKAPGVLTITDGGTIHLEVFGILIEEHNFSLNILPKGLEQIERVVGKIETYGFLTLDNCYLKEFKTIWGATSYNSFYVEKAFLGKQYNNAEVPLFSSFRFSIENLDTWIDARPFAVKRKTEEGKVTVTYERPEDTCLTLSNNMKLLINADWIFPSNSITTEAKITQRTFFEIRLKDAQPLEDYLIIARRINMLLRFAQDNTVCIEDVTVTPDQPTNSADTRQSSVYIFYQSLPYVESQKETPPFHMLFNYKQIESKAEDVFNKWMDAYNRFGTALDLYFSTTTNMHSYLESKFLALAQGLETFHRRTSSEKDMDEDTFKEIVKISVQAVGEKHSEWLRQRLMYGNELSLRQRVNRLVKPFKNYLEPTDKKTLANKIVVTRNYLTHYDESLESKAASKRDLWVLCLRMAAMFQLHLLYILGFTDEEILLLTEKRTSLRNNLRQDL